MASLLEITQVNLADVCVYMCVHVRMCGFFSSKIFLGNSRPRSMWGSGWHPLAGSRGQGWSSARPRGPELLQWEAHPCHPSGPDSTSLPSVEPGECPRGSPASHSHCSVSPRGPPERPMATLPRVTGLLEEVRVLLFPTPGGAARSAQGLAGLGSTPSV